MNDVQEKIVQQIFDISGAIRYLALYQDERLDVFEKDGISDRSGVETDKYEELLVNPTLVKLATQRGNIDCGGMNFLTIRYGNFSQLIIPVRGGHISLCIEKSVCPVDVEKLVRTACAELGEKG